MGLSECKSNERESIEYWDNRLDAYWDKPYHGMFLDDKVVIDKMDKRNLHIITNHILKLSDAYNCIDILECGCGNGRYIPKILDTFLNEYITSYVATDFATRNVCEAIELYRDYDIEIFQANMNDLHTILKGRKFHMIFMVSALSSIQNNFNTIVENLSTLLHDGEQLHIMEQEKSIICYNNWKSA